MQLCILNDNLLGAPAVMHPLPDRRVCPGLAVTWLLSDKQLATVAWTCCAQCGAFGELSKTTICFLSRAEYGLNQYDIPQLSKKTISRATPSKTCTALSEMHTMQFGPCHDPFMVIWNTCKIGHYCPARLLDNILLSRDVST